MSYRLLIVDDEVMIRQGIRARLEYLHYSFGDIREAEDGEQALGMLREEEADIVITDIQMTDMNGIELIRRAKEMYPRMQFIILSGYAEFAYAEQAIRLGVNDYLLKPISNDSLVEAMDNTIGKLKSLERNRLALQEGSRVLEKNRRYLFEQDLNALLFQPEPLRREGIVLKERLEEVFPLSARKVLIALIHIDSDNFERQGFDYQDTELVRFIVRNIFEELEITSDKVIVNSLTNKYEMFAILSNQAEAVVRLEAEHIFAQMLDVFWNKINLSVSVGVSGVRDCISQKGTKEAKDALMQRILQGSDSMHFHDEIRAMSTEKFPSAEFTMLGQYIKRGDVTGIEEMIDNLFSDERIKKYNAPYIRIIWVRIIDLLLRSASSTFEKEPERAELLVTDLEEVMDMGSLSELRAYLYTSILDCLGGSESTLDTNAGNRMKLAAKYITDHYNEDISINELAERFSMSPNYFSSTFKKVMGNSTIHFLKVLRVEKAKELLEYSDKNAVEIAKEVGYEDSQYFLKVFKKVTGQTTSQFRKSVGNTTKE